MVMGGDSCSEGHEFESQHYILDGHFSHIFVVRIVMFVLKDKNNRKRGRGWSIFKKDYIFYSIVICVSLVRIYFFILAKFLFFSISQSTKNSKDKNAFGLNKSCLEFEPSPTSRSQRMEGEAESTVLWRPPRLDYFSS